MRVEPLHGPMSFLRNTRLLLILTALSIGAAVESGARRLVERLATTLEGSLLVRFGDPAVADAFCASRLGGDWGHSFGTLPQGLQLASIVQRHCPPA